MLLYKLAAFPGIMVAGHITQIQVNKNIKGTKVTIFINVSNISKLLEVSKLPKLSPIEFLEFGMLNKLNRHQLEP